MSDVLNVLKRVRNLLAEPAHWIKEDYAKTADGRSIDPNSPDASCWCLVGAIMHETAGAPIRICPLRRKTYDQLMKNMEPVYSGMDGHGAILNYNDDHTYFEVLNLLDVTIKDLEGQDGKTTSN